MTLRRIGLLLAGTAIGIMATLVFNITTGWDFGEEVMPEPTILKAEALKPPVPEIDLNRASNYTGIKNEISLETDLDNNQIKEVLIFRSYEMAVDKSEPSPKVFDFVTDFYLKTATRNQKFFENNGYLRTAEELSLDENQKIKLLMVVVKQGKLDNYLFFGYGSGRFNRVPVEGEIPSSFYGTLTDGWLKFKDTDNDGLKEMVVYSRVSPVDQNQTIGIFEYRQEKFWLSHNL